MAIFRPTTPSTPQQTQGTRGGSSNIFPRGTTQGDAQETERIDGGSSGNIYTFPGQTAQAQEDQVDIVRGGGVSIYPLDGVSGIAVPGEQGPRGLDGRSADFFTTDPPAGAMAARWVRNTQQDGTTQDFSFSATSGQGLTPLQMAEIICNPFDALHGQYKDTNGNLIVYTEADGVSRAIGRPFNDSMGRRAGFRFTDTTGTVLADLAVEAGVPGEDVVWYLRDPSNTNTRLRFWSFAAALTAMLELRFNAGELTEVQDPNNEYNFDAGMFPTPAPYGFSAGEITGTFV